MKALNLGCGNRFHSGWINLDFYSSHKQVMTHNLLKGIPFSDNYFDLVYHSHVLEHFPKKQAVQFLKECYRVLKPQGIIRVVVPDLEKIARLYLQYLEEALEHSKTAEDNYNWILLEMYDQTVRNVSGGEMKNYLFKDNIPNESFIINRCGKEVKEMIEIGKKNPQAAKDFDVIKSLAKIKRIPKYIKENFLKIILGSDYKALEIGRFRQGGEVHQWMYDRYSLRVLLESRGFEKIVQQSAYQSYIPNWIDFHLDTEPDHTIYKPDSLYMEAIKPLS